ncbi:MAG TPA: MFS transporter [Clostridiales bacterium]|nr:MFS transporter [Clostridiales bacterium]
MSQKSTMLACEFGITTQSAVNNLAPILFVVFRDSFGLSYTMIAQIMLFNFLVQIITDFISIKILHALDYRKSGILAQVSAAIGLIFLGVLPKIMPIYTALFTATFFMAFGGGLLEVMVSPIVDSISDGQSSAEMNILHSFYCWGQVAVVLVSTTAIKIFSNQIWWVLPIFWSIVPIISMLMFSIVPIPDIASAEKQSAKKPVLLSRTFLLMCLLMITSGASEITMAEWSSVFAEKGLGIDKFAGDILGPCLFAALMGSGRLLFGIFGKKLNLKNALISSSALCSLCYITAAASKNPYVALFACALTGFSVSIMWPGVYSYSSSIISGGTAMFGILALCGDVGCSLGSYVTGYISDFSLTFPKVLALADKYGFAYEQMGLKIGIACAAIFPIFMLFLLLISGKSAAKE